MLGKAANCFLSFSSCCKYSAEYWPAPFVRFNNAAADAPDDVDDAVAEDPFALVDDAFTDDESDDEFEIIDIAEWFNGVPLIDEIEFIMSVIIVLTYAGLAGR